MPKGGERIGAGRPRKDAQARWLGGVPSRHGEASEIQLRQVERFGPPDGLQGDGLAVWERLSPHAFGARTLTRGTAEAFRDLCEAVVLRDMMAAQIQRDGLTYHKVMVDGSGQEHVELKAHPLLSQHRGMCQRVETGLMKFRLSPMGKPMETEPEKPTDPFAEFDQTPAVN